MEVVRPLLLVVIVAAASGSGFCRAVARDGRNRRDVPFAPESVLQLTVGVSAAFDLGSDRSGQMNYALQQNLLLPPADASAAVPLRPEGRGRTSRGRKPLFPTHCDRDRYLRFFARWTTNGTECPKKTDCQLAEAPLRGGILEEMVNFLFAQGACPEGKLRRGRPRGEVARGTVARRPTAFPTATPLPST